MDLDKIRNTIAKTNQGFTCDGLRAFDKCYYLIYLKNSGDKRETCTYTYSYDTIKRVLYNLYSSVISKINNQIKSDKDKLKIEDYSIENDYYNYLISLLEKHYDILLKDLNKSTIQYINDYINEFVHSKIGIELNNPISIEFEKNGETVYTELFNQRSSDPNCVSQLKKGEEVIGYRYYSKDGTFFSCVKNGQVYEIIDESGSSKNLLDRIHEIYHDFYEDKQGYEITGSSPKTPAISAAVAKIQKDGDHIKVIPTTGRGSNFCGNAGDLKKLIEYSLEKESYSELTNTVLIPISANGHTTLICIDRRPDGHKPILIDSSTAHSNPKNKKSVRRDIFGKLSDGIIKPIMRKSIQINGTCSYWVDSLMEVLTSEKGMYKYKNMNMICRAATNGTLWLEAAAVMSNVFDKPDEQTVKIFADTEVKDHKNYFIFQMEGISYGLSRNCWGNRFVNLENLRDLLLSKGAEISSDDKEYLDVQIAKQKLVIKFETAIHTYDKLLNVMTRIETKLNCDDEKNKFCKFLKDTKRVTLENESVSKDEKEIVKDVLDKVIETIRNKKELTISSSIRETLSKIDRKILLDDFERTKKVELNLTDIETLTKELDKKYFDVFTLLRLFRTYLSLNTKYIEESEEKTDNGLTEPHTTNQPSKSIVEILSEEDTKRFCKEARETMKNLEGQRQQNQSQIVG